jgi:hypothetical protein
MAGIVKHAVARWQDRAAVRSEQELDPTLRRRLDRLPQRLADRRATRAERRLRPRSADDIERALAQSWGKALRRRDQM